MKVDKCDLLTSRLNLSHPCSDIHKKGLMKTLGHKCSPMYESYCSFPNKQDGDQKEKHIGYKWQSNVSKFLK